jgi:hypothetical protein
VIAEELDVTRDEARALIAAGAMGSDTTVPDDYVDYHGDIGPRA